MNALHPERERLEALVQGLSPRGRNLLRHVTACPQCGEVFSRLTDPQEHESCEGAPGVLAWQGREELESPPSVAEPEPSASEVLATDVEPLAALRELRESGVDLGLEAQRRTAWSLVEHVLGESRRRRYRNPQEAEHVALLALRLVDRVDEAVYGRRLVMDLKARVWTYVAVARCMAAELRESQKAFDRAWECLRRGTGDLLEEALWLEGYGNLLADQGRHGEAIQRLEKAVHRFLMIGDEEAVARAMMNLAAHQYEHGEAPRAISTLETAAGRLDGSEDEVLTVSIHHNRITFLAEAGQYEEAQRLLDRHADLYRDADPLIQVRREWVQARIEHGTGNPERAEELFVTVREDFIRSGLGYDAALVSLDLAIMYAEQGRFSEMRRLADEMLPIFRAQDIHREALAALAIFQQAARVEGVTLKLARELAEYLGKARNQPHLRFEATR